MKLYTEEQVRMILDNLQTHVEEKFDYYIDEVIDEIIPIELPSDEEIEKTAKVKHIGLSRDVVNYRECFKKGAKWMKEQILNQNK